MSWEWEKSSKDLVRRSTEWSDMMPGLGSWLPAREWESEADVEVVGRSWWHCATPPLYHWHGTDGRHDSDSDEAEEAGHNLTTTSIQQLNSTPRRAAD